MACLAWGVVLALLPLWLLGAAEPGAPREPRQLCVFVPISPRSSKDEALALAALETWASREARRRAGGALVRFLSPPGASVHPALAEDTVQIPTDVDTDYKRLPIRTFRMWEHLGVHETELCRWFMKADADSYVNLAAVAARLSCFDSREWYYFGVTHAILPAAAVRAVFPAVFFAHGGSGYLVSRGLVGQVGYWAAPCLAMTMNSTEGNAMEDVAFAMCLLNRGVKVLNYGFHGEEFVVNFHQARDALLNSSGPYRPSPYWDAQPPPLHPCILVVHPIERAEDVRLVHERISAPRQAEAARRCAHPPMRLARQAEVRMSASGSEVKAFWTPGQLLAMDACFKEGRREDVRRCTWRPLSEQCLGLSSYSPAATASACAAACCSSGDCRLYQFRTDFGCWLGELEALQVCEEFGGSLELGEWEGGAKVRELPSERPARCGARARRGGCGALFRRRVRSLSGLDRGAQDAALDLYASSGPFRRYCEELMAQGEDSEDFARRLLRRLGRAEVPLS